MFVNARSKITMFQLFFLSFAYVFSGLFLIRETSFLSMLIPLASVLLFCALGYPFLQCAPRAFSERQRFLSFLSCGKPHFVSKAFFVFLTVLSAVEMLLSWVAFSFSVRSVSPFVSFPWIAVSVLFLSLFIGAHGLTILGRFSELSVFLILALVLQFFLFRFEPVYFGGFSENLYACFLVTPAPLFYLFSMTVLQSSAVPKPLKNPFWIPVICFCGAVAAVLCAFLFMLYGAERNRVFFLIFGWMSGAIRLALLICVCTADRESLTMF